MSGQSTSTLKASGLHTNNNSLSSVPQGSMSEALNVVIDKNEVIEQRRGLPQYGLIPYATKQLLTYKDVVLAHSGSSLFFDSDLNGDFRQLSSSVGSLEEVEEGLRIKFLEGNGNLYFTTKEGIKKFSSRGRLDFFNRSVRNSGGLKALDIELRLNFEDLGFLSPNSKVAYKVVFGYKDINDNLIIGSPSSSSQIYNSTTSSCFVDIRFSLPLGVTTEYFYQLYRTGLSTGETPSEEPLDPGEEFYMVIEDSITSSNITDGYISLQDKTPDEFRRNGTLLYTNPVSGEGILQANEPPPFARDIANYKEFTFYANISSPHRLNFSLLSVEDFVSNVDTFTIEDENETTVYTFQGSVESFDVDFTNTTVFYNSTPGSALFFTLASANIEKKYYVWTKQSDDDQDPALHGVNNLSGYVGIRVDILAADTKTEILDKIIEAVYDYTEDFNIEKSSDIIKFLCSNNGYVTTTPTGITPFAPSLNFSNTIITADGNGSGEDIENNKIFLSRVPSQGENGPTVSQQIDQTAKSLIRVVNSNDPIVAAYYTSSYNTLPGLILFESREAVSPNFSIYSSKGEEFNPTLPPDNSGTIVTSGSEIYPNGIAYSKYQQPEAVPLVNYLYVGPKDRGIQRIIPLRDSLFILKEDGVYRLSGDSAPFSITPFDFSVQLIAPDTAVVLNNQIYALSTQGVIVITEGGVQVISRPIENKLLEISREGYSYKTSSFGVSYESDRTYTLHVPTIQSDTVATQSYRYNTFTSTWTRSNVVSKCGIVNFGDNKLYLGSGVDNYIERERKTLTRADYSDRQYERGILINTAIDNKFEIDDINLVESGDVIVQKQTVTTDQFNRLLIKLDSDQFITDKSYFSSIELKKGQSIRNKLELLCIKLDNDLDVSYSNFTQDIDFKQYTVNSIVPQGTLTKIFVNTPDIKVGRFVRLTGSNTLPSLDLGLYEVVSYDIDHIMIKTHTEIVFDNPISCSVRTDITSFEDVQGCYNYISSKLNVDENLSYSNYPMSYGYVEMESAVDSINRPQRIVNLQKSLNYLEGDITLYKAIKTKVVYNPHFFGDIVSDKQVREGTIIFENDNFSKFIVGYSSDKLPSFEDNEFLRPGLGDWGQFGWDQNNWGGIAAPIPLRTYIPKFKQRCRFLVVKTEHKIAREKYSIFGITLHYRPYNIRTNK